MQPFRTPVFKPHDRKQRRLFPAGWTPVTGLLPQHAAFSSALPFAAMPSLYPRRNEHSSSFKDRFAGIPVFIVMAKMANGDVTFVTTSAEADKPETCLLFMDRQQAEDYLQKCKTLDNGKDMNMQVVPTPLSRTFDLLRDNPTCNWRFVPSSKEVRAAIQLYEKAGMPVQSFKGVPMFQADGLQVVVGEKVAVAIFLLVEDVNRNVAMAHAQRLNSQVVVPIFFSKEDVDGAVATAHAARLNSQVESFLAQAATHKKEYDSHLARFAEAKNESDKKLARELAERSQQEEASCRAQARLVSEQPKPAVEVCCLEDVMRAMKEDRTGVWDDAFFVMSGGLKGQVGPEKDQKPS